MGFQLVSLDGGEAKGRSVEVYASLLASLLGQACAGDIGTSGLEHCTEEPREVLGGGGVDALNLAARKLAALGDMDELGLIGSIDLLEPSRPVARV